MCVCMLNTYVQTGNKLKTIHTNSIVSIIEIELIMETITIVSRYNAMYDSNHSHMGKCYA